MRIIAGTLKGRRLDAPSWPGLRPTSDKLRETLFNVLAPHIDGVRMIDGYAGSGAVGIEALSRGAAHVTFIERDPRAVRLIEANLQRCQVPNRYAIIRAGFEQASKRLPGTPFDLVFLDPPYGADTLAAALDATAGLLAADGVLVIEHARRDGPPAQHREFELTRDLTSGDSALAFYEKRRT